MKITYTKNTLEKLETLFKELGFKLRVEKGNFRTGACMIAQHKVIVVNKFSNLESKINALLSLIQEVKLEPNSSLDEKQLQFFYQLQQTSLTL